MKILKKMFLPALIVFILPILGFGQGEASAFQEFPSETPAEFKTVTDGFNFARREVMIPMRDGVKLFTVILLPVNASNAPILFTRTPYNASALTNHAQSNDFASILKGYDNTTDLIVEGGYIRVVQDVRGKYGSEGDYVMNRTLIGPQNPTTVDHATDTWDTIDWLIKNIPETNGKVGVLGISYNGFLALMALVNPHPALKVAIPMNAMVDGWMGDDWFHYGAFRQQNMSYMYEQVASRGSELMWWTSHYDDYDMFMQAGSAGELGRQRGMEQLGFWKKILAHPSYDAFWQEQAVDKILAAHPLKVPVMLVHSLWDAEDIYGTIAVYNMLEPKDKLNDKVFLVMGPWKHGQGIGDGNSLGAIKFNSDTALYFRQEVLRPFLDQYLKDPSTKAKVSPVVAFETGTNKWRQHQSWPPVKPTVSTSNLYLKSDLKLDFKEPQSSELAFDEYISDPAKPVPFRARPIQPTGYEGRLTWPRWLVDDQREASGRTDVLVYYSDILTEPVKISGQPIANLVASTSGTDSDWVVKLIDVYPDQVGMRPEMGGYQLMVSGDIFRGRYRKSFEKAAPLVPNKPLTFRFALPTTNHVFLPGHRIMVQIQSSWFPLYDRNPQSFVPNIFWAKPEDFIKAVQRIYHTSELTSFIEMPIVSVE